MASGQWYGHMIDGEGGRRGFFLKICLRGLSTSQEFSGWRLW